MSWFDVDDYNFETWSLEDVFTWERKVPYWKIVSKFCTLVVDYLKSKLFMIMATNY
jgi:hypothetical protein